MRSKSRTSVMPCLSVVLKSNLSTLLLVWLSIQLGEAEITIFNLLNFRILNAAITVYEEME